MISKKIIVWNSQDESCRDWISLLSAEAWQDIILVDYYENSEHTIRALDDLRSQNIHYSGGILVVMFFQNPLRIEEKHIGTLINPVDWEYITQQSYLAFAEQLIEYTCPESERVKKLQDALCMSADIPLSVIAPVLACKTLNQIEGVYAKIVREKVLSEQQVGCIIKLKEQVYAER